MSDTIKTSADKIVEKYFNQPVHFPYIDSQDGQCIGAGYVIYNSAVQHSILEVEACIAAHCVYFDMTSEGVISDYAFSEMKRFDLIRTELKSRIV